MDTNLFQDKEEAVPAAQQPVETPPPLPPKRSPHKQMSVESQLTEEGSCTPPPVAPVKGVLTLEAMNGNVQVKDYETIQARPLPTPPAPVRYNRLRSAERQLQAQQLQQEKTTFVQNNTTSYSSMDHTLIDETANFQTCRDTLMTSGQQSRTLLVGSEEDDNTMADSIVDSLVSCTDTLICEENDDDDPYPSVNFESGMSGRSKLSEGTN